MAPFGHLQDVVGQLPFLKTYSHLLLCFPIPGESQEAIAQSVTAAALKLTSAFPWLAGKVVDGGLGGGSSAQFKVVPCSLWAPPNTTVRFKDCSDCCPSYEQIAASRGPASLLDGDILAPRRAFPESYQETDTEPAPVLAFQVNFVRGGILLDCAAQHNLIDMNGIEQCYRLLATAMCGEEFPSSAVEQGNRDRRTIVPLLGPAEQMLDHSQFKRTPPPSAGLPLPPPAEPDSPFSWRYFRFSRSKLADLKTLAQSKPESSSDCSPLNYISTNDALSAFCWQRVTVVRLRRRGTPNATAKFCRAVDARQAMGVPREYMGDLVTIATSRFTFQELADAPLSTVASTLRKAVLEVNNEHYIRSFATFIANEPDRSTISYGGNFNPDTDVGCSSWARVQLSNVNFGILGKPTLVRRPNFVPLKSDIYFMPQTEAGDIDALLCFNQADFEGLEKDGEWGLFADFIG